MSIRLFTDALGNVKEKDRSWVNLLFSNLDPLIGARIVLQLLLVGPLRWPVLGLGQVRPEAKILVVRP